MDITVTVGLDRFDFVSEADRLDWVRLAANAADDKKASDTLIIDVGEVLAVTDYFVITSAANARQVAAITEAIEERLRLAFGIKPHRVEGKRSSRVGVA